MLCDINLPGYLAHLPEKRLQTMILFSVFVLQFLFEHIFPANKKYNNGKNELRNTLVGIANAILLFIPSALLVELLSLVEENKIGLFQKATLPFWVLLIFTIVLMDLLMYWWHRFNHTLKFLWRFHKFHHKDEKMNSTTTLRFHIIELWLSVILKAAFFLVMGFSFLPVLIYEIIFFTVVLIHHSNIRISEKFDNIYRAVFSSPLMHRIHHSNKRKETDTNYSSVFSGWDRLFGTYKKEAESLIVFGVEEEKTKA